MTMDQQDQWAKGIGIAGGLQGICQKPPIGLKPRELYEEERINDILAACSRYSCAKLPIPIEWVDELKVRIQWK